MPDFAKYHALGNDYLIVDPSRSRVTAQGDVAKLLCDRRFGVGADGVLFAPQAQPARGPVSVRIFNSDGSPCARSGNGVRIFARWLADTTSGHKTFTIRTTAGDTAVELLAGDLVRAGLGAPTLFEPDRVVDLMAREVTVATIDNGNPHAVVLGLPLDAVHEIGEAIAGHRLFPGRVNVQFAAVDDRRTMRIEIWERGAGYTLASGSSACAAAAVAHRLGLVDNEIEVKMPGGSVWVDIDVSGEVSLTGPVEAVATGDFAPALRQRLHGLRAG